MTSDKSPFDSDNIDKLLSTQQDGSASTSDATEEATNNKDKHHVPRNPEPIKKEKQHRGKKKPKSAPLPESHMTILQSFNDADISQLREPGYRAQTLRMAERDLDWLSDTAYDLSKLTKPRKVSQADIVRISFKLFEKLLQSNKEELHELLMRIK